MLILVKTMKDDVYYILIGCERQYEQLEQMEKQIAEMKIQVLETEVECYKDNTQTRQEGQKKETIIKPDGDPAWIVKNTRKE